MLRFKHFLKINEQLSAEEKAEVAKWPQRTAKATKATDHYFGKGVEDKHTQLSGTHDKSEIHHAIERHLGKEITQDEYKSGQTKDEHGRPTRIGKLLNKSKAPDELSRGFENDSTRQGKKFSGLSVRTTRSAEGVAGQTSHNQSWEQQSCKNFNTGLNRQYLKHEVEHGTVVHYLHDENGKEIARSTAQPFKNDAGHVIYKTDSHYGIDHKGFKDHVEKANKELSGEHKEGGIVYTKSRHVYDNDANNEEIHPNATKDQLTHAYHNAPDDYKGRRLKTKILNHENTTTELLDKAQTGAMGERADVASSPKATLEHLNNAVKDKNPIVRVAAGRNKNLNDKHITKLLKDKDEDVRKSAIKNKNANSKHIDSALNDEIPEIRASAAEHPNATKEHIDKALSDSDHSVRSKAANNQNATKEHIDKALNDKHSFVRMHAANNPNATKEHIDKALNDPDFSVRGNAAINPNATKEHIHKALNDNSAMVQVSAVSNRNATKEHLNKALSSKHEMVVNAARKRLE